MLIGHYGVAFIFKSYKNKIPLGVLFLAVVLLDVLLFTFLISGIEHARFIPGFTAFNSYDLYDLPLSHSLLGALMWSIIVFISFRYILNKYYAINGNNINTYAVVISGAVLSHWILDLAVHTPDLLIIPGFDYKVGLGLWNYPFITFSIEMGILIIGYAFYIFSVGSQLNNKQKIIQLAFISILIVMTILTPFLPDPNNTLEFALTGLLLYFLFAIIATGVDWQTNKGQIQEKTLIDNI